MIWKFYKRGTTDVYIYVDLRNVKRIAIDDVPYEVDLHECIGVVDGVDPIEVDMIPRGDSATCISRLLMAWAKAIGATEIDS